MARVFAPEMILLDTSVLIDSLSGPKRSAKTLRAALEQSERILIPSLVLYEWLRGPRLPEEIAAQEALFPSDRAVVFGHREASLSAHLAIAACAIARDADLWTLNRADFADIPQLRLAAL